MQPWDSRLDSRQTIAGADNCTGTLSQAYTANAQAGGDVVAALQALNSCWGHRLQMMLPDGRWTHDYVLSEEAPDHVFKGGQGQLSGVWFMSRSYFTSHSLFSFPRILTSICERRSDEIFFMDRSIEYSLIQQSQDKTIIVLHSHSPFSGRYSSFES